MSETANFASASGRPGGDWLYVVMLGSDTYIFGDRVDALAFSATRERATMMSAQVLDHADARRLIEQEGG